MSDSPIKPNAHDLATRFKPQIKLSITGKYSIPAEDLLPLIESEEGAYISEEIANTLCCLVIGLKNGHLYLVLCKISDSGSDITQYKCEEIA